MRLAQLIMERLRGQTVVQAVPRRPHHITRLSDNKVFMRQKGGFYLYQGKNERDENEQELIPLTLAKEIVSGAKGAGYSLSSQEANFHPSAHQSPPFLIGGHAA